MNIAIYTDSYFNNDKLFDETDFAANRDGCLDYMIKFKKRAEENGFNVHTADLIEATNQDIRFYFDVPDEEVERSKINYLFLYESKIIRPQNFQVERHARFNKVFTWADDLVDNKKYFKMNFLVKNDVVEDLDFSPRKKFITLIAGNKEARHKNELYSARLRSIRWWEKKHHDEFEFFGGGWELPRFNKPFRKLNRYPLLRHLLKKHTAYRGKIENKNEKLRDYKFCICYENAAGFPGYITEKVFDCFKAGTIPIYWGPPNFENYVPKNCYIDRTEFKNERDLYEYLHSLDTAAINSFQEESYRFLMSEKMRLFSSTFFSEQVIPHLLQDSQNRS